MRRSTKGLARAVSDFLEYKEIQGLSSKTITSYCQHLRLFLDHAGNVLTCELTPKDVNDFLLHLRHNRGVSNKTLYNYYTTLRSFSSWISEHSLNDTDLMSGVPQPRFVENPPEPLSKREICNLLDSCRFSRLVESPGKTPYRMERPTYLRDTAVIYVLLDTGCRASELCNLKIGDVSGNQIIIRHGKGNRKRYVFIGRRSRQALYDYLLSREYSDNSPLFSSTRGGHMSANSLYLLIKRLGGRADIDSCHPHRFRHTFAINYLRSGGDVFTLQSLLGHSDLTMVRRYTKIAKVDLEEAFKRASPVDNLF